MKHAFVPASLAAALALGLSVPAFAAEKQDASTITLPTPPAGKGQIVFFRKGGLQGSAVACSVHSNGQKVSSLGGGRYFVMVAEPGRHEFSVKTEATDTLALEVEPDETQFAACKIKMGLMVGRPDISPATEAEFRAAKKLGLVDADDMGVGALKPEEIESALAASSAPAVQEGAAEAPAQDPVAETDPEAPQSDAEPVAETETAE